MKKFTLLMALALAGCATTQQKPDLGSATPARMPELPASLATKATRLPPLTDPSLGGVHRDGAEADSRYNALAYRFNFLVDAWGCTRDALVKGDEDAAKKCFSGAVPQ